MLVGLLEKSKGSFEIKVSKARMMLNFSDTICDFMLNARQHRPLVIMVLIVPISMTNFIYEGKKKY